MKLLILYGPPATGKFTVAKELSKLTGYPLFHNHLAVDIAWSVFPFGTKRYSDLSEHIRLSVVRAAAKHKISGMILTFAYGVETFGGKDDLLLKKISSIVTRAGGKVFFIKFSSSETAIKKRIANPSRKKFKKITEYAVLRKIRSKYAMDALVPFAKSIILDTTKISPPKAANFIKEHIR
ncbi:MAG: hypothetical protein Q7R72_00645 [bacterium]|nr:hypothetical protein [bacterium]